MILPLVAFRSLGVARTNEQGQRQFVGVYPPFDPLRDDSKSTVDAAKVMGLDVKMVTGDQVAIAKEIGRQLDLGNDIVDARLFTEAKPQDSRGMADAIEHADGFARVFLSTSIFVDVLQQRGHIVGMTGDGLKPCSSTEKS